MGLFRNFIAGLASLFHRHESDREMDEELGDFLDRSTSDKMNRGMSREQALRAVRMERGGAPQAKEAIRGARWEFALEVLWKDVRKKLENQHCQEGQCKQADECRTGAVTEAESQCVRHTIPVENGLGSWRQD